MPERHAGSLNVSTRLADFVVDCQWQDLPPAVQHAAARSLLNGLATALAGSHDRAIETLHSTLLPLAGPGQASLVGHTARCDALTAAFINAAAMNVHDFDDTHLRTVIHPTAPVAPALLALAEQRRSSGKALLLALALGIETACRIGNAVSPGHYARGWHITATCGVFGAAMAAGKLLGLDARALVNALGAAAAQSSGSVETLGFMAKSVGVGQACRGGLLAAMLAGNGLDGPPQPLEGTRGFLAVTADDPAPGEVTEALGSRWETLRNIHKPYPCGVVLFPVIDACLQLRESMRHSTADIAEIVLYGHPLLGQRADRPGVQTGREAQVSAQHTVAVSLLHGEAGLEQFTDQSVADSSVLALRQRVHLRDDLECAVTGVRLTARFGNGTEQSIKIAHARGTDERPLSDAEIEAKCDTLLRCGAPHCPDAPRLKAAIWNLAASDDAGALMALTRPS